MSDQPEPVLPPRPTPHEVWARTALWVGVVALVTGAGLYVFKSCIEVPGRVIDRTSQALASVASSFTRGTITTSFISYASSVTPTHHLQFATLKQMEIFTRTDAKTAAWIIPLPEVVVEARAPVEFTYYLDLNAEWQVVVQNHVIQVLAPAIQFNKPAVDVSRLELEVRKGVLRTKEVQEDLRHSISALAAERARENLSLVRETGRRQTAEFVEKWLAKSFTDGKDYAVKVRFKDEAPSPGASPIIPPSR